MTWQQDGIQYVAVTSGYGGVYSIFSGDERLANVPTGGSLWVFAVRTSTGSHVNRKTSDHDGGVCRRRRDGESRRCRHLPRHSGNTANADQAQIDQGKSTFAQKCSHCHGPNMVNPGTVAPDLRRFPDDKERFFTTVKQGKNGRMPPWGDLLSDDQIADLWAYMSSRRNP